MTKKGIIILITVYIFTILYCGISNVYLIEEGTFVEGCISGTIVYIFCSIAGHLFAKLLCKNI